MTQNGWKVMTAPSAAAVVLVGMLVNLAQAGLSKGSGSTSGTSNSSLRISELRVDQLGADTDEYFELFGTAGSSLTGYWFLALGDNASDPAGVVEMAIDLSAWSLGNNGRFVAHESTFGNTLFDGRALTIDPFANHATVGSGDSLNFENSDTVTYMLVRAFTGSLGMDLDSGNDGALDLTPWAELVDSVAFVRTGSTDPIYSAMQVGPIDLTATGGMPPHAWFDGQTWQIGSYNSWAQDTPGSGPELPAPGAVVTLLASAGLLQRGRGRSQRGSAYGANARN